MAKFFKADEDICKIVDKVADELSLSNFVDFETLDMPKSKEVATVMKASALAEYLSDRNDLVLVVVRGDAFDKVDEDTKYFWIRMALDQVSFDSEKGKVVIGVPTITVPVGFYEKYKTKAVDAALLGKYTLAQIEDEEKQRKAEEAAQKKAKKKKQ